MELITDTLLMPVQTGVDAAAVFQNSLHELEIYVTRSQNPKLADSFQKFKEALYQPDTASVNGPTPAVQPRAAADTKPQHEDRCYLAMSSLFTVNVKNW